jgi:hypothetical protein
MAKTALKKKQDEITQKDLKEAILQEIEELVKEERLKIIHRAKQRLAGKFGK